MSEAQNWNVHYLQNGDPQVERTRLLSSMYDALRAACDYANAIRFNMWGPERRKI